MHPEFLSHFAKQWEDLVLKIIPSAFQLRIAKQQLLGDGALSGVIELQLTCVASSITQRCTH
jgi:hypothetical protein